MSISTIFLSTIPLQFSLHDPSLYDSSFYKNVLSTLLSSSDQFSSHNSLHLSLLRSHASSPRFFQPIIPLSSLRQLSETPFAEDCRGVPTFRLRDPQHHIMIPSPKSDREQAHLDGVRSSAPPNQYKHHMGSKMQKRSRLPNVLVAPYVMLANLCKWSFTAHALPATPVSEKFRPCRASQRHDF